MYTSKQLYQNARAAMLDPGGPGFILVFHFEREKHDLHFFPPIFSSPGPRGAGAPDLRSLSLRSAAASEQPESAL